APQALHRPGAVLVLALLVLDGHDDAGLEVGDADGRIGRVDRLAAGTGRTVHVDADVLVVDVDLDLLGFREHGHGRGRGVDPSGRFGRRDALDGMDAALRPDA